MKFVIQRVTRGCVKVEGEIVGQIGKGLMILVGLTEGDSEEYLDQVVDKFLNIRLFDDAKGARWKESVKSLGLDILLISQFTLYNTLKGNKPDFHFAMEGNKARELFDKIVAKTREKYDEKKVQTGKFGEYMFIDMECDGPVTINWEYPTANVVEANNKKGKNAKGNENKKNENKKEGKEDNKNKNKKENVKKDKKDKGKKPEGNKETKEEDKKEEDKKEEDKKDKDGNRKVKRTEERIKWVGDMDYMDERITNKVVLPHKWRTHPRLYGKDSRYCRVCRNTHGLIRKYGLNICRKCFRERANLIGFKQTK